MSAIGGSIESVTLNGRQFTVASDADSNRKQGGFENDVQSNGDGTARLIKTRVPWMASDLTLAIDDLRDDQKELQKLADGNAMFPITATYASGAIFNGVGQIVGDLQISSQATTASLGLSGSGQFLKQ